MVVGATGTGKSWYAWERANRARSCLFFDTEDAAAGAGRPPGPVIRAGWEDGAVDLVRCLRGKAPMPAVVQYVPRDSEKVARAELAVLVNALIARPGPEVLLAVDEAYYYAAEGLADGPLHLVARRGRKYGLALLAVTQRPADVSKTLVTQCSRHILFKTSCEGPWFSRYGLPAEGIRARLDAAPAYSYLVWDGIVLTGPFGGEGKREGVPKDKR